MADKQVTLVVGARPNFMKAAPLLNALMSVGGFAVRLIHTGQHFDTNMSEIFFDQLHLPKPDAYLNINTGNPANQMARVILSLHEQFSQFKPGLVIVFGDVNSTLATAVVSNKMDLPLAHVEAGLRSFDRSMPEENNRILTDMLADFLFTPSPDADQNLLDEGLSADSIYRVGNIMVDSLLSLRPMAAELGTYKGFGKKKSEYALVTLHRAANVDEPTALKEIVSALEEIGKLIPVLFPVHPRTKAQLQRMKLESKLAGSGVDLVGPLSYLEFLNLMMNARVVLTDSGGIQEETTVLGVHCLTLRENTERPVTLAEGTNRLVGTRKAGILNGFQKVLKERIPQGRKPELWDGKTAERIVHILRKYWN